MQLVCPACGFKSIFPDEPAGMVQCGGCGKRLYWGMQSQAVISFASDPREEQDDIGFSFSPIESQPTERSRAPVISPKPLPQKNQHKLIAGLVAALAVAMLAVFVLIAQRGFTQKYPVPTAWDLAHRNELVEMKSAAEALALSGKLKESYQQYQQIIALVANQEVKDPVALEVIASARAGQDRVFALLMSSPQLAPIVAVAPEQPQNGSRVIHPVPVEVPNAEPTVATTLPADVVVQVPTPATTEATTEPVVVQLDPAQSAADNASPLPGPPPRPTLQTYSLTDAVTDQQIGDAISKGVFFLGLQFHDGVIFGIQPLPTGRKPNAPAKPLEQEKAPSDLDGGSSLSDLPAPPQPPGPVGPFVAPNTAAYNSNGFDALGVYALLTAGRAVDTPGLGKQDKFTANILEKLKQYHMNMTYHVSLRAAALAVFNRTQDTAALEEDVRWLQAASMHGAYTYDYGSGRSMGGSNWDNSNSQYGLLGVWSGAQSGQFVPKEYWQDVSAHWINCAGNDGTWNYRQGGGSPTMTCAGIASMLVTHDYLNSYNPSVLGEESQTPAMRLINSGLTWLDSGDNCIVGLSDTGYGLYGLERVGLASGFKYFGEHDWYAELAKKLINQQHLNGSWGDNANPAETVIDTSYALLFLARGRHPILYNKLRYNGNWGNRPQDVAHLARFAAHELERPLNWQVVNLRRNWFDWLDSPVLYIAGNKRPDFTPEDYNALRQFSEGGGLIFTHADGGSAEFQQWVETLVRTIFPKDELTQVPRDHAIYSIVYSIKDPPPLLSVSNGSRLLLVDSPTDLAGGWQLDWKDANKSEFQLGVNLFVYAAGKRNFKNRLASTYIPPVPDAPESVRQITRLQYNSQWDPEPYAWQRFARYFQWETHQAIQTLTVPMEKLLPNSTPLAVLTGTVRYDFTPEEVAATKAYVQAGGVLLIDACGGQSAFTKSVETTLLSQAFNGATIAAIAPNHPLLVPSRAHADDLSHPLLRDFANENGGKDLPIEAFAYGKGWVIFSRLDLTTGLLGTSSWGILGFDPAYAQSIVKNAVLWAEARNPAD